MKKAIVIFLVLFIFLSFLNSQSRIPRADCCYHIWAAGCNLGWSTSLMFYTQMRERWSASDRTTYDNILRAGRHIESAYMSCSRGGKVWQDWLAKKKQSNKIASSFSSRPNRYNRRQLYNELHTTYNWANKLMWAVYASRLVNASTCSEKYFRFGWLIANAQQTLKIANECYIQGSSSYYNWKVPFKDAKRSIATASQELYSYYSLRPVTGSCVNIRDLRVDKILKELHRLRASQVNLQYMIRQIDWVQLNLQNRLRDRCGSSRNVPDPTHPGHTEHQVQPPQPTCSSCPMRNPDPSKSSHKFDTNGNPNDDTYLHCGYFSDGALQSQTPYINNKKDGLELKYGTDLDKRVHSLGYKTNYKGGKKHGIATIYCWCQTKNQKNTKRTTWYKCDEALFNMGIKIKSKGFPDPCHKK